MSRVEPAIPTATQNPENFVPKRGRSEPLDIRDLPNRALPTTSLDLGAERENDIILSDEQMLRKDYLDALAFAEEPVTIVLHRSREKFPPTHHAFYVNGQAEWVPVGKRHTLKRKFVEGIVRAQTIDFRTESYQIEGNEDAATVNQIMPSFSTPYSFEVLEDKNPNGRAWLEKLRREN